MPIMDFNGYKFLSEKEAIAAVKACNDFYKIPKSKEELTQNWTNYESIDGAFVIRHDPSIEVVLGKPIRITAKTVA